MRDPYDGMSEKLLSCIFFEPVEGGGGGTSPREIEALLKLARHRDPETREAALTRLLFPPGSDELAHLQRLLDCPAVMKSPIAALPQAIVDLSIERIALTGKLPETKEGKAFYARLLGGLPKPVRLALFERRYPFLPLQQLVSSKHLAGLSRRFADSRLKRQWRILRKRILLSPSSPGWAEITLADLQPFFARVVPGRAGRPNMRRRLEWGGAILSAPSRDRSPPVQVPFRETYWGGKGRKSLSYLDRLTERQADELRKIRETAREISGNTGRVVFSWHNATLAAVGGWAFENLRGQFPSGVVYKTFRERVLKKLRRFLDAEKRGPGISDDLLNFWEARLVEPKLEYLLWRSGVVANLDETCVERWEQDLRESRRYVDTEALIRAVESGKYGWPSALSPHQAANVGDIVAWADKRRRKWKRGLLLLKALAQEAAQSMARGDIPHFVLPWIDKFFISSLRDKDTQYLAGLTDRFEDLNPGPVILFWEDTSHFHTPSFARALERLRKAGRPFRGIGIFDEGKSDREEAVRIVSEQHSVFRLFAMRPYDETHNPRSLRRLIDRLDYEFFDCYDSSWKDESSFLYAGTQVMPLLSVQSDMEAHSPWLAAGGRKYAFGAWFRCRLRRLALGARCEEDDALCREYAEWANLC